MIAACRAAALRLCGLLLAACAPAALAQGWTYSPGQGLSLGDSGFVLGGYAAASLSDAESEPWQLRGDSLSAMLWWEGDSRLRFFMETELENALTIRRDEVTTEGAEVALERLHVDYAFSDAFQLRLGKFLTPIGRWNVVHAAPLTWTTSRPLITESTFPTNATGAMAYGTVPVLGRGLDWSVYAAPGAELAAEDDIDTFEEAYGLRLAYALTPELNIGLSYVTFEQQYEPDERKKLYGIDFRWAYRRFELSGEYAQRNRDDDEESYHVDEDGGYLQAVIPLTQRLYGVLRYEQFLRSDSEDDLHYYLGGFNYHFTGNAVLKLEFSKAVENDLGVREGFLSSVAVLF
jgi:hypothetical protein